MQVLIVSDSHGSTTELEKVLHKHQDDIDYFIHCGDSELELEHPIIKKFHTVKGNCDFGQPFPEEIVKKIGNHTIFVTHGHHYSVKSNLMRLSYKAEEISADIICFGHSHQLGAEMIQGKLYINPGSVRLPRGRIERTYVILDIQDELYQLKVFDIEKGEITELSQVFPPSN